MRLSEIDFNDHIDIVDKYPHTVKWIGCLFLLIWVTLFYIVFGTMDILFDWGKK